MKSVIAPFCLALVLVAGLAPGAPLAAAAQPDVVQKPATPPPPPLPLGPELWHGARIGMSQADVATHFPAATPSAGETLPNGAKSALSLSAPLGGAPATAQFYFDAHGLAAVIIDRRDVAAGKTDENLAKAHQVVDQLTSEYGKPANCSEQRRLAALTCIWTLGEAKAVASYRDVGGAAPTLTVSFRKLKDASPWAPGPVRKLKAR